eukprot:gene15132-17911_t
MDTQSTTMTIRPMLFVEGGRAKEAIQFYCDTFDLKLTKVCDANDTDIKDWPLWKGKTGIVYSKLDSCDGTSISVIDQAVVPDISSKKGYNVHIGISHGSLERQKQVYDNLAKEGCGSRIITPIGKSAWGSIYFSVEDKYGFIWESDYHKTA